jgi:tetratricopeptide (TPR) repeat protein
MIYNRGARLPLAAALFVQVCFFASAAVTGLSVETAEDIRKNKFIEESLRLQKQARRSFAGGDYDMAEKYAQEAVRAAADSDIYVGQQVNMYTAGVMMRGALEKLALADSAEVKRRYPVEFYNAKTYYNLGLIAEDARQWKTAISNADRAIKTLAAIKMPAAAPAEPEKPAVVEALAEKTSEFVAVMAVPAEKPPAIAEVPAENISEPPAVAEVPAENISEPPAVAEVPSENAVAAAAPPENTAKDPANEQTPLPANYVVRAWETSKDCFWNIAGRTWVYGNPYRWPVLYRANKKKLPDPKNPNIIEPGTVIDIPSLNGEKRSGLWDPGKTYSPLGK